VTIHSPRAHCFLDCFHAIKQDIGLGHPSARVPDGKLAVRDYPPLNRSKVWHPFIATNLPQTAASLNFSYYPFLNFANFGYFIRHEQSPQNSSTTIELSPKKPPASLVSLHHPKGGDAIQYKKRCFALFCISASIRIDSTDSS
jgi:hypothetical protein